MAIQGSEQVLSSLIYAELAKNIPSDSDPQVFENLRKMSDSLASAIVKWFITAAQDAFIVTIGPGIAVAGTSPSGPIAGQTVAPGQSVKVTVI